MTVVTHFTTETQSTQSVYSFFVRSREPDRTKATALRAGPVFSNLGSSCDNQSACGFLSVGHMLHVNPGPRSGTEDFALPRKSPGQGKE